MQDFVHQPYESLAGKRAASAIILVTAQDQESGGGGGRVAIVIVASSSSSPQSQLKVTPVSTAVPGSCRRPQSFIAHAKIS